MERIGAALSYPPLAWRCAAVREVNPETKKEEWRIIRNPTIGDVRSLREKGACIMHLVVERHGNQVDKIWYTTSGLQVTHSTEFLSLDFLIKERLGQ